MSFPNGKFVDAQGRFAVTVSRVAGPGVASFMKPHRRNSATASAAASYRDAAGTWTACTIPWVSVKETRQVRVFATISA